MKAKDLNACLQEAGQLVLAAYKAGFQAGCESARKQIEANINSEFELSISRVKTKDMKRGLSGTKRTK